MRHRTGLFPATAFQYFRACCSGLVILSFLSIQVTGCAPMKIPPYKADAFNTYKNQVAKNNLYIAVSPMTDEEQQKKYFGVVLADVGVLPVFIIAENRSASQRFLLRDDLISLQNKATKGTFSKPKNTDVADDSDLESTRRGAEIASNVLLSGGAIILSLALAKNSVDTKAIQDSLFDKTLYTQTVLPGKTVEGFAYFRLSDKKTNLHDLLLRIEASEEGTQEKHSFEFVL
jgi:hypothetical protein